MSQGGPRAVAGDGLLALGLRPEDLAPATADFRAQLFLSEETGQLHVHVRDASDGALPSIAHNDRLRCIEAVLALRGFAVSFSASGPLSQQGSVVENIATSSPRNAIARALAANDVPPDLLGALQRGGLSTLSALYAQA